VVLDHRGVVAGDPDKAPQMLQRPADASPPLPLLTEGKGVRQLRAALTSLAFRDATGTLPVRVRAWVGRVTGRRNRYLLDALVRATGEIADRCDVLTTRLTAQDSITADVARTYGEELARLRAEVLHLQSVIESSSGSPRSAR
jgi:hypothetical protein